MSTPTIGFIGTGSMGTPMAEHVAKAYPDQVFFTARAKDRHLELIDKGVTWCDSPAELSEKVDVLISVLPDLPQLREMMDADVLTAREGRDLLLIICSTSSPVGVREYAEELTDKNVTVVDAPLSGGVEGASDASLSIMVGGNDEEAVKTAIEILENCGTPVHLGPLGAGEVAKACNQLIVGATNLALGEAAVLAERSGLDLTKLFELLGGGYAGSRILETKGFRMADEDYEGDGAAKYMLKDLGFVEDIIESTETKPAITPALKTAYQDLADKGLGDFDLCVARKYIEEK